jgi:hypothetical protein
MSSHNVGNTRSPKLSSALHSCPMLCTHLGLKALACLAPSSRSLRDTCYSLVRLDSKRWLQRAIDEAEEPQHWQSAVWVLQVAPSAVAAAAQQLVCRPAVPLDIAKKLVATGVRIAYSQLLAAAQSMVEGVEVWVQAQQQLGINTDVPAAAIAACNGATRQMYLTWVSQAATC